MKTLLSVLGRALQLLALLVLPSAIWVAQMGRSETSSIAIFLASLGAFFAGTALRRISFRL